MRLGYALAAVTYDVASRLADFAERRRIAYPLLSDKGSRIISAFGLIDPSAPKTSRWYGFAKPMIVVLDAEGIVRHRFSSRDYRDRPEVEAVLEKLGAEPGA